jgi:hypothetical protein
LDAAVKVDKVVFNIPLLSWSTSTNVLLQRMFETRREEFRKAKLMASELIKKIVSL